MRDGSALRNSLCRVMRVASILLLTFGILSLPKSPTMASAEAGTSAPVTVRVGVTPSIVYSPLYIALANGYFAKRNIKIELTSNFASPVIPLIAGDLDVAVFSYEPAIISAARGHSLPLIAMLIQKSNVNPLYIRSDLDKPAYHQPYPLNLRALPKGITIAQLASGGGTDVVRTITFEGAGMRAGTDYYSVNTGGSGATLVAALCSKRVDAVYVFPPFDSAIEEQGCGKLIQQEANGPDVLGVRYNGGALANPTWLARNTAAAKRFAAALVQAMRFMRQTSATKSSKNLQRILAITKQYIDPNASLAGVQGFISKIPRVHPYAPQASCARIARIERLMVQLGQIDILPACDQILALNVIARTDPFAPTPKKQRKGPRKK